MERARLVAVRQVRWGVLSCGRALCVGSGFVMAWQVWIGAVRNVAFGLGVLFCE